MIDGRTDQTFNVGKLRLLRKRTGDEIYVMCEKT